MSFTGELFGFQDDAFKAMLEHRRLLLALEMGLGKTVITIAALEHLLDEGKIASGLIITPSSLKYQWKRMIEQFTEDATTLVIDGPPAKRQQQFSEAMLGEHDYIILNYEQCVNDWDFVKKLPRDYVVVDECFVAGTPVGTPDGPVPIEDVKPGDAVLNAYGVGLVCRTIRRQADVLVKVTLSDGWSFVSTGTHKFFTAGGWQAASMLTHGQQIITRNEAVRLVWEADADAQDVPVDSPGRAPNREVLREILFSEMEDASARGSGGGLYRRAAEEDYGQVVGLVPRTSGSGATSAGSAGQGWLDRRVSQEGGRYLEGQWQHDQGSPGEWGWPHGARGDVAQCSPSGLGLELRRLSGGQEAWLSDALQDGFGPAFTEAGSRGGWELTSAAFSAGTGREEDRHAGVAWVDRVEVLQPGSAGWAEVCGTADQADVYDLEVTGHPSYSVGGLLVHNCTAIKSFTAKRSRRIKRLQAKYLFGLSGQPVENRPEEVFSIMQWIDSGVLGRFDTFDRTFIVRNHFGRPVRYKNLPTLHRTISQSMVRKRRTDPDVVDQLPRVTEELVSVEFDPAGAGLYRRITKELLAEMSAFFEQFGVTGFDLLRHYGVAGGDDSAEMRARGRIMSRLTALRMLCDNPVLLRDSADKATSQYAVELKDRGLLSKLPPSPKMKECVAFIREIMEADPLNKVVVFSFFKGNLRLLEQTLPFGSVQFTGDMNARQKDAAKQKFKTDPGCRVFLSSDAGGYGVDLPEGRYLINFDLPWSAGKLDQRNARIIRLSSTWESVTLLTMLMRGSVEERMYDLLTTKQATAAAVVDGRGIDRKGNLELNLKSLTEFLQLSSV